MSVIVLPSVIAMHREWVLPVTEFQWTIDRTWTPYVQATLRIPSTVPDAALLSLLDENSARRILVVESRGIAAAARLADFTPKGALSAVSAARSSIAAITAAHTVPFGGTARASVEEFDLTVRSAALDKAAGEIVIQLASDDAKLSDYTQGPIEFTAPRVPHTVNDRRLLWEPVIAAVLAQAGIFNAGVTTPAYFYRRLASELVWPTGETAWDFLHSLGTPETLRLACDERRHWFTIDLTTPPAVLPVLALAVENAQILSDLDADSYYDEIVVKQTYQRIIGTENDTITRWATARANTTPRRSLLYEDAVLEIYSADQPEYEPGGTFGPPSAQELADTLLARYRRRARVLTVTDYDMPTIRPGTTIASAEFGIAGSGTWLVERVDHTASLSKYDITATRWIA